ncbi:MAG: hypothetical protein OXN27_17065 [Candidatus Poribacteria bacterium]|nr:hypothetical protein [Candidatus Poribacteria bacterium]
MAKNKRSGGKSRGVRVRVTPQTNLQKHVARLVAVEAMLPQSPAVASHLQKSK